MFFTGSEDVPSIFNVQYAKNREKNEEIPVFLELSSSLCLSLNVRFGPFLADRGVQEGSASRWGCVNYTLDRDRVARLLSLFCITCAVFETSQKYLWSTS